MQLATNSSFATPDSLVFVENFELSLEDEGHVVRCKSKQFAAFAKRITSDEKPISAIEESTQREYQLPLNFVGKAFWGLSSQEAGTNLSCMNPYTPYLINRELEVVANLSFLMLEGLEEGIEISISYPLSTGDALDYYHCCLQAFQQIYVEWLRPFRASSSLLEKGVPSD